MESKEFSFYWRIENYKYFYLPLASPKFTLPYKDGPRESRQFYLRLESPSSCRCELFNANQPSLSSDASPDGSLPPLLKFTIAALSSSGEYEAYYEGRILREFVVKCGSITKFVHALPENNMTIRCSFLQGKKTFEMNQLLAYTRVPTAETSSYTLEVGNFPDNHKEEASVRSHPVTFGIKYKPSDKTYNIYVEYHPKALFLIPCQISFRNREGTFRRMRRFDIVPGESHEWSADVTFDWLETTSDGFLGEGRLSMQLGLSAPDFEKFSDGFENVSGASVPPPPVDGGAQRPSSRDVAVVTQAGNFRPPAAGDLGSGSSQRLLSDLKKLYDRKTLSDFTLVVGSESFPVHRGVLSARSEVFEAMFATDMRERTENSTEVTDVDPGTMDLLLRFVYYESFEGLDIASATKLYAAANKYQIESLKERCAELMADELTVESVCDVLATSDFYQDDRLRETAKNFVFQHSREVFDTDEWKEIMTDKPDLTGRIMHEFCLNNS